jgi:hypothetical protein
VIQAVRFKGFAAMAMLLCVSVAACHREEQAVAGVAQKAANAECQAQASATLRDQQRAELDRIPLPTKSLYLDIHEPGAWANPFLSVEADILDLRINLADANPSPMGEGTMLRPAAARRQEVQLRLADLAEAVVALPAGAWHYGRVIAVAEAPGASPKDRARIRRNVESAIQQLNDLGIVVEEWPSR